MNVTVKLRWNQFSRQGQAPSRRDGVVVAGVQAAPLPAGADAVPAGGVGALPPPQASSRTMAATAVSPTIRPLAARSSP